MRLALGDCIYSTVSQPAGTAGADVQGGRPTGLFPASAALLAHAPGVAARTARQHVAVR